MEKRKQTLPLDSNLGNPAWEHDAADGHLNIPEDSDDKRRDVRETLGGAPRRRAGALAWGGGGPWLRSAGRRARLIGRPDLLSDDHGAVGNAPQREIGLKLTPSLGVGKLAVISNIPDKLACGVVAYIIALLRENWARADIREMEFLTEVRAREASLFKIGS